MSYRASPFAADFSVARLDVDESALPEATREAFAILGHAWDEHGSGKPAIVAAGDEAYIVDYVASVPEGEAHRALSSLTQEISLGTFGSSFVALSAMALGLAGGAIFAGGMAVTAGVVGRRFSKRWRAAQARRDGGRRALGAFITRDALIVRRNLSCSYFPRAAFDGASMMSISSVGPHHGGVSSYWITLHYRDTADEDCSAPMGFGGFSLDVATQITDRLDAWARHSAFDGGSQDTKASSGKSSTASTVHHSESPLGG